MRNKDQNKLDKLYEYINTYQIEHNMSPTTAEMLSVLDTTSRDVVNRYVTALVESGRIRRNGLKSRNIDMIRPIYTKDFTVAKIVGSISCGLPCEEQENELGKEVLLPMSIFGEGEYYILTACGDSMTGAGIEDGDTLVIRRGREVKSGEIVVALVDGYENTLKRYYNNDGVVRLVAENDNYADIFPQSLEVQGTLVSCMKFY